MRSQLTELYRFLRDSLEEDPTNIVVLYYYSLTAMLERKFASCKEALKLLTQLYQLEYREGRSIVIDYYHTKAVNIQQLLSRLLMQ